jgi:hypothetical protein
MFGEHKVHTLHARLCLSVLLATMALVLTACPAMTDGPQTTLTPGNWSVTATSSNSEVGTFKVGGNLTQSGNALSGSMYVVGSMCFDVSQPVAFTGTVSGTDVTLTSADVNGQVFSVTATSTDSSTLSGTYTVTGGCAGSDSGTATASAVLSISGTWSGPVIGAGGPSVTLSMTLAQGTVASSDGSFPLTGTLTYSGSSCSVSGTITNGFVAGSYILVNANTVETDASDGSIFYNQVLLDSSSHPHNMTGPYEVGSGLCAGDLQELTLNKP